MGALSRVEHNATKHIRSFFQNHKTEHVKALAYIISLISCVSAGSVMIISLYSLTWMSKYKFTSLQINLISTAVNIGGYLTPPFLGLLCDAHGPVVLSLTSMFAYVPHYYILSRSDASTNFNIVLYCFFMIGVGTSSLFFSALISCSKFFPNSKLLSISLPTTCYGISSIWLGRLITHGSFFKHKVSSTSYDNYLDLKHVYKFFCIFYLTITVFDWVSTSIVSRLKGEMGKLPSEDVSPHTEDSETRNDDIEQQVQQAVTEEEPLLKSQRKSNSPSPSTSPSESQSQSSSSSTLPVSSIKEKMLGFYKDPSAHLLLLVMFISIGPMEMYITNMGTVTELYDHGLKIASGVYDPQNTLSLFSMSSTLVRLFTGLFMDFCSKKLKVKNIEIYTLWALLCIGALSQFLMLLSNKNLMPATSLMGMTYGGLFTTMPVVVMSHWGSEIFGTAYGSCMIAPAFGSSTFGIIFAHVFQKNACSVTDESSSYQCIGNNFQITMFSYIIALFVAMFIYLGMWRKH